MDTFTQTFIVDEKPANLVAKHAFKQHKCVRMKDRKKTAKKRQLRKRKHKKSLNDEV